MLAVRFSFRRLDFRSFSSIRIAEKKCKRVRCNGYRARNDRRFRYSELRKPNLIMEEHSLFIRDGRTSTDILIAIIDL